MSLLTELENYQVPTIENIIKHVYVDIKYQGLAELFKKDNLFLQELNENHPVYINGLDQYELVKYEQQNNQLIIYHFTVHSSEEDEYIDIANAYQHYLRTGQIEHNIKITHHTTPLPVYHLSYVDNQLGPTVKLKNGKRAIITESNVIEGVDSL